MRRLRGPTWQAGLKRTLEALPEASKAVVLADTPHMMVDVPRCLAEHPVNIAACVTPMHTAIASRHDDAERAVVTATGATYASLSRKVCSYDPCPVVVDELLLWRDTGHLTATYARTHARTVHGRDP